MGETPHQQLSANESRIIEEGMENPLKVVRLDSLRINLKSKTATDTLSNRTFQVERLELLENFVPNFIVLQQEGARVTAIKVKDVADSIRELATVGYPVPDHLVPEGCQGGCRDGETVFEKLSVAVPENISRVSLRDSYSDMLYGWLWDKLMGRDAEPPTAILAVQLRNIIFVNNPLMMQRFRDAVEKLDVTSDWSSCPEASKLEREAASKLESLCSEFNFASKYKSRIALMMHVTDDHRERVILSCGFSMALNGDDNGYRNGIEFTSDTNYAIWVLQNGSREYAFTGNMCITFSWVAIGNPHFTRLVLNDRPSACTTLFGLTNNGLPAVQEDGAAPNTPLLFSFAPELCCPFAVAEFDV